MLGKPCIPYPLGSTIDEMPRVLDPFRFVLIALSGWISQNQLQVIEYLREENRVLREQLRGRRLRFSDDQRRRLAAKAKGLGRKLLAELATVVTPETLLNQTTQLSDSSQFITFATPGPLMTFKAFPAGHFSANPSRFWA